MGQGRRLGQKKNVLKGDQKRLSSKKTRGKQIPKRVLGGDLGGTGLKADKSTTGNRKNDFLGGKIPSA